jgi:fructose-specific phosphotransferase system IIC component
MTNASGKSPILLYGVLFGVTSIALTVIMYLGGIGVWMSKISYLGIAIPVAFAFFVAYQLRKQDGYLEFSDCLKSIFKVMVIGLLLSMIFDYVLLNYIDKPFNEALMQATQQEMERELIKKGMSQDKIDEFLENMGKANKYALAVYGLTFAIRCIIHFVLALIVSAIMKKKRPVFENSFNQ